MPAWATAGCASAMGFGSSNGGSEHIAEHAMDNPLRVSGGGGSPRSPASENLSLDKSALRDEPLLSGAVTSGDSSANAATFETEDAASMRGGDVEGGGGSTFDVEDTAARRKRAVASSEGRKMDHFFASPALQEKCRHLVHNQLFEALVTTVVVSNTISLAYKGPNRELSKGGAEFLDMYDFGCTVFYTLEMCVRIVAYGAVDGRNYDDIDEAEEDIPLQRKALLRDSWGRLDFIIISMSWLSYLIEALGLEQRTVKTSMLRSLRVLRILHSIQYFKSIRAILTSLQYSVEYRASFPIPWLSGSSHASLTCASCSR